MNDKILLREGFKNVFSSDFLKYTEVENDFIQISSDGLEIGYNLDVEDMDVADSDDENNTLISELENSLPQLKDYIIEDFEITYFTYDDEYTATMWKYSEGKLLKNYGWIGDFCESCKEIEDESEKESAQNDFVDENYSELKYGNPSMELLDGLRAGLFEAE
jgi:hypothetical protein